MKRHRSSNMAGVILLLTGAVALAQGPAGGIGAPPPPDQAGPPPGMRGMGRGNMPPRAGRPPMERAMGQWWNNPQMAEKLGVTADQKKKMDDIFQQHRLKLIDLHASLQKAEAILEPLVAADQPDEAKIVAQIDRVAQARADLEKANARMLLGIRQVLTPDQWKTLREERPMLGRGGPGRMRPMQGMGQMPGRR